MLQLKQGLLECLSAQGGRGSLGADELFPVFVYVVLVSQPPQLASTLAYVQRFRSPMALKSEAGCYFTHLQAAVSFLEGLAAEKAEEEEAGEARLGDDELNGEINGEIKPRPHPDGEVSRNINGEINAEADSASPSLSTCPSSPKVHSGTPSESIAKVAAPSEAHDVCVGADEPRAADDVAGYRKGTDRHTDDAAAAGPARTRSHSNPASAGGESAGGESAGGESASGESAGKPAGKSAGGESTGDKSAAAQHLSFTRSDLAQRRTQTVESAACKWEMQIESLIATHPASSFLSHDSCRYEDTDGEEYSTRACGADQETSWCVDPIPMANKPADHSGLDAYDATPEEGGGH